MHKIKTFIIILILALFFVLNYSWLDSKIEGFLVEEAIYETAKVSRIIDGDTIEIESGEKVRLLGINTPEKGEKYYAEAKNFLEEYISNETIQLEYGDEKFDKYNRILAYIHFNEENINLKIVEEGFATPYFPSGKDVHYYEFSDAWNACLDSNKNLCEKSQNSCSACIILKEFDYYDEEIIFSNSCNFSCSLDKWKIKDEGRKEYTFENFILEGGENVRIIVGSGNNDDSNLFWENETSVWTSSGDTLFLRDEKGKLILLERY